MAAPPTPAWAKEAYRSLTGTPPLSVVGAGAVLASVPECSILLTNTSPFLKISPPGRPGKPSPLPPAGTCAPPTGDIYLVQFVYERTPNRVTYEALVADTEFRPNIELWRETNGGRIAQIVFGRVIRGVFADGKMIEGPFAGPDTTFMTSSSGDCR